MNRFVEMALDQGTDLDMRAAAINRLVDGNVEAMPLINDPVGIELLRIARNRRWSEEIAAKRVDDRMPSDFWWWLAAIIIAGAIMGAVGYLAAVASLAQAATMGAM